MITYFYRATTWADAQRNGPVKITMKENGPVVASLLVESEAPGCRSLVREVRLTADADYVELIDTVDKLARRHPSEAAGFPFRPKRRQGKR